MSMYKDQQVQEQEDLRLALLHTEVQEIECEHHMLSCDDPLYLALSTKYSASDEA